MVGNTAGAALGSTGLGGGIFMGDKCSGGSCTSVGATLQSVNFSRQLRPPGDPPLIFLRSKSVQTCTCCATSCKWGDARGLYRTAQSQVWVASESGDSAFECRDGQKTPVR